MEYRQAIERKQVAQQEAERMKYVLEKAEKEKDNYIIIAEGDKQAAIIRAEGEAQAIKLKDENTQGIIVMRYETLYNGQKIPILGLGTWTFGGGMTSDYSQDDKWVHTIKEAIQIGYTHIDTAEMYGAGHTEELLGRALKGLPREHLFITTKVLSTNLRYKDVLKAFGGSLKRLGTDYIDLFLIHWPNSSIPLEETFRAFNELVRSGRVKYVGVSNFDLAQLRHSQELSDIPISTNQVEYNVFTRGPERNGVLEYCQKNSILLTAYEPLGKGRLIHHPELRQIASRYKISAAQVAINWLIQKPKVITIPMSSNIEHLKENLEAVEITLSEEDLKTLDGFY